MASGLILSLFSILSFPILNMVYAYDAIYRIEILLECKILYN